MAKTKAAAKQRVEHDLLGDLEVPSEAYWGVQTQRAMENVGVSASRARR